MLGVYDATAMAEERCELDSISTTEGQPHCGGGGQLLLNELCNVSKGTVLKAKTDNGGPGQCLKTMACRDARKGGMTIGTRERSVLWKR